RARWLAAALATGFISLGCGTKGPGSGHDCTDKCSALGTQQCSSDQVQTCARQSNGGLDWSASEACPSGQSCQGSACACTTTCGTGCCAAGESCVAGACCTACN